MTLYDHDDIPSAEKIEIKPFFEKRYKDILGDRYDEFMDCSMTYLRKCIRVNTLKISVEDLHSRLIAQGWVLSPVPWCKEGFFVEGHKTQHRFDIGNLPEHVLGYFYVQEAASMIPPVVLFQNFIDPDSSSSILDLCAAPGSKTTQIAQYLNNEGVLFANDTDLSRLRPLSINLQRMGITNTIVTLNAFQINKNSMRLREIFSEPLFDRVLVDAPCSGTGTIRKSFKALSMYSDSLVKRMSGVQKALIKNGFKLLKPGGEMVYSTCTLEPAENEAIVSHLLEHFPEAEIIPISLDIKRTAPILEFENLLIRPELKDCLRIYPQDNDSEGFFVCLIRKNSRNV